MEWLFRKRRTAAALILALMIAPAMGTRAAAEELLVPIGRTVGIEARTEGLLVSGLCEVETEAGGVCPASDCGIEPGDVIIRLAGVEVRTAEDFARAAAKLNGEAVTLTLLRGGRAVQYNITPALSNTGEWRLGLWLRDGMSGIGTLTYYDPASGEFGALGHSISDSRTGEVLPLGGGYVTDAAVTGIERGAQGKAGELRGVFETEAKLGEIALNTLCGVFGRLDKAPEGEAIPVAEPEEIRPGRAGILANVEGREVREYEVEVARTGKPEDGRLSVRVTDEELLKLTGGIVQGMSGCPIIQDGRLIGAVTHVLLADPARGYGITIRAMREAAREITEEENAA